MIFTPPLINPFTAEPPMQIHVPSTPCDILTFNSHARTTLSANLCRVKRSFKPYQNVHDSVQESGEKGKNPAILSKGHKVSCQHNGTIKPSFIPEPPVTTRADPCPSTACDVTSFNVKDNFVC